MKIVYLLKNKINTRSNYIKLSQKIKHLQKNIGNDWGKNIDYHTLTPPFYLESNQYFKK